MTKRKITPVLKSLFIAVYIVLVGVNSIGQSTENKNKGNWMRHAKFGIFVHYMETSQNEREPFNMGKKTSWDSCVDDFDVNVFANQMHDLQIGYVIFTVYQGSKYMCIPNETFERVSGYKRGEATSHRDLVGDLSVALRKYNIKLMLYVTGDGTYKDHQSSIAFDNPIIHLKQTANKFTVTPVWVNNWSKVLQEMSMRYGRKVSGWWVDGAFKFHGYNDSLLGILYHALTAGNSKSIVGFNSSPQGKVSNYSKWDDYTAGEMYSLKDLPPPGGKLNGVQWHILSFLGKIWQSWDIRFTKDSLTNYINQCNNLGGAVTLDVCLLRNGSIYPDQLNFLKQVSQGIKERQAQR